VSVNIRSKLREYALRGGTRGVVMRWLVAIIAFLKSFVAQMKQHPTGFRYIFLGELAERSAYYGGSVLFMRYATEALKLEEGMSGIIIHLWKAFCYLLPIAGGWLADRYLGRFKTIIYLAPVYVLGVFLLAYWQAPMGFYIALVALAVGSGIIKPNISPLMGRMYNTEGLEGEELERMKVLREDAFSKFYASINIGAFLSMGILPGVRDAYGYQVAFAFPAAIMVIAFVLFFLGRKHYPAEDITKEKAAKAERTNEQRVADRKVILGMLGIFVSTILFWVNYEQYSTTWITFAENNLNLYGLSAEQLQIINPLLVIILSLFFFSPFWVWVDKKRMARGKSPLAFTQKMKVGFMLMVVSSLMLAVAGFMATESYHPSCVFEMLAIVFMTVGEICVMAIGLESAFKEAPAHLQSTLTALFLVMIFFGNLLAGTLMPLYEVMAPGFYFLLMSGFTVVGLIIVVVLARSFERKKRKEFQDKLTEGTKEMVVVATTG